MRNLRLLDIFRDTRPEIRMIFGSVGDHTCGAFWVPSPIDQVELKVLASSDGGWDHVSVSRTNRCPNWPEMDHVRKMFFQDDETVMQLHVPAKENINNHPYCLHLWRPQNVDIPRPPDWMVGTKAVVGNRENDNVDG